MGQIHIMLQGKGGSSKTTICSFFAQYKIAKGHSTILFDADPVNASFYSYRGLQVNDVTRRFFSENTFLPEEFDIFLDELCNLGEDEVAIIDTGASSFMPVSEYLSGNKYLHAILEEKGQSLFIHTVITAMDFTETREGLVALAKGFTKFPVILWFNQSRGLVLDENQEPFEQSTLFKSLDIEFIVKIPVPPKAYAFDIENLLKNKLTFKEVQADTSKKFNIMSKGRVLQFRDELFQELDKIPIF